MSVFGDIICVNIYFELSKELLVSLNRFYMQFVILVTIYLITMPTNVSFVS